MKMTADNIFIGICSIVVLIMLIYYIRRKRKIISFLFGSITGAAALLILNKYGAMLGIDVPLNLFNVAGSAVLGVPFVVCLAILTQF
jgi:pro-sigmaK processing inhibitor BofA